MSEHAAGTVVPGNSLFRFRSALVLYRWVDLMTGTVFRTTFEYPDIYL